MRTGANPAASIIRRLGGEAVVASLLRVGSVAPYRWQYSKAKGGTNGLIPQRHHVALLLYAAKGGLLLEPSEFLQAEANEERTLLLDSTTGHVAGSFLDPTPDTAGSPPSSVGPTRATSCEAEG